MGSRQTPHVAAVALIGTDFGSSDQPGVISPGINYYMNDLYEPVHEHNPLKGIFDTCRDGLE